MHYRYGRSATTLTHFYTHTVSVASLVVAVVVAAAPAVVIAAAVAAAGVLEVALRASLLVFV